MYRGEGSDGQPYNRYSQAMRALASPGLFENRGSYRLLGLDWDSAGGQMRFGYTAEPELRYTANGIAVANFTIASTARTYDRASGEWHDGETLFLRCSLWR